MHLTLGELSPDVTPGSPLKLLRIELMQQKTILLQLLPPSYTLRAKAEPRIQMHSRNALTNNRSTTYHQNRDSSLDGRAMLDADSNVIDHQNGASSAGVEKANEESSEQGALGRLNDER